MGLTARFAGRDDLQHSLRYAANCCMLFTEAPWLEPHGSEVRDGTPPRGPVCQAVPTPHEVAERRSAAYTSRVVKGRSERESGHKDAATRRWQDRQHNAESGSLSDQVPGFARPAAGVLAALGAAPS